jgi:hypothetical protein
MRKLLIVAAIASFGCGQTTSGNDGGPDGSENDGQTFDVQWPDQITSGCSNGTSNGYVVDASACVPQLSTSFACNGSVCTWTILIPCASDAGADGGDGGGVDCQTICNDVQPPEPHSPPNGFCQPFTSDAGMKISCGGCGV